MNKAKSDFPCFIDIITAISIFLMLYIILSKSLPRHKGLNLAEDPWEKRVKWNAVVMFH